MVMIKDKLRKQNSFIIFGAQVIAYGAYCAIKHLYGLNPEFFAVSKLDGNPTDIDGVEVTTITSIPRDKFIIVAVTELVQKEVIPYLYQLGFEDLFILTQHEEFLLMSEYFKSIGVFRIIDSNDARGICRNEQLSGNFKGSGVKDIGLYEVRNHRDIPLDKHPILKYYEKPIQAGAFISDKWVSDILDSTGDNISNKNKQYCEMTAAYWVWKNTNHEWKGIEHYRRHMLVSPQMLDSDVDVILPLPYICYPNTSVQFKRFVSDDVFEALLEAIEVIHPDEAGQYREILFGKYQYTYNIVCARREIFDAYCKWFFEITEYMETMADRVSEIKETRALSYVAEVLTNIYFMSMQEKLVIRHVEREIYV